MEGPDELWPGSHCDIVEGANPAGENLLDKDVAVWLSCGVRLEDAVTGAAEAEGCSGASEKASLVDARDCVSAVPVTWCLLGTAAEGWLEGKAEWDSCVGVVKVSVEAKDCVSVGISAS